MCSLYWFSLPLLQAQGKKKKKLLEPGGPMPDTLLVYGTLSLMTTFAFDGMKGHTKVTPLESRGRNEPPRTAWCGQRASWRRIPTLVGGAGVPVGAGVALAGELAVVFDPPKHLFCCYSCCFRRRRSGQTIRRSSSGDERCVPAAAGRSF